MDPDLWRRVDQLYHLALAQPASKRSAFLDQVCAGDSAVRQEVDSLLLFEAGADTRLQAAVREVASQVPELTPTAAYVRRKLGRYELLEEIGKGGMGVVYRAVDPAIGRTVAIKTILAGDSSEHALELRARLMRESQAAGRLSHPNIVAVYDICQESETAYIVMEFVQGRTLDKFMRDHPLPHTSGPEAIRIVRECAAALDYAHKQGVIHRDIKPANIMLQLDGAVKIADFGIAKVAQSAALTQSSATLGSPVYMAPEQWRGQAATGQTDQYALATVAYALLTGRRPFEGDSVASLAALTLLEEPPAAVSFNPGLNPEVDKVLRKGLSKNAEARFPTCGDFALALQRSVETESAAAAAPASRRKWNLAVLAIGLFVMVAGLSAWFFLHGAAPSPKPLVQTTPNISATPPAATASLTPLPSSETHAGSAKPAPKLVVPARKSQPQPPSIDNEVLGEQAAKQGNYAQAVKYLTRAISSDPGYRPYFTRGGAYQHLGDMEKAIADYSRALSYKPDSSLALHDRAFCEMRLNLVSDATRDYDAALKLQPDNPRTWNGRGAIYYRQGDYRNAIDYFSNAIRLDPNFAQAYENRAAAEKAIHETSAAAADLSQAKLLGLRK